MHARSTAAAHTRDAGPRLGARLGPGFGVAFRAILVGLVGVACTASAGWAVGASAAAAGAEVPSSPEASPVSVSTGELQATWHKVTLVEASGDRVVDRARVQVDATLQNHTGGPLEVETNFHSPFDGLSLVLLDGNGREVLRRASVAHQSPFSVDGRSVPLPPGATTQTLLFPDLDLPTPDGPLTGRLVGGLPGTAWTMGLASPPTLLQWSGPLPLSPRESACVTSEDCAVLHEALDGSFPCCQGCGTESAGSRAWVERVHAQCEVFLGPASNCPPLACPTGPQHAVCTEGQCVSAWQVEGEPARQ
jgi:hypothetical protein